MKKYEDPEWNELNDPEVVDWKRVRSAIEHENELTNHRPFGILAAQKQHDKLVEWWAKRNIDDAKRHPPICGDAPLVFLDLPYYAFPFVFWVAWIIFMIVSLSEYVLPHAGKKCPLIVQYVSCREHAGSEQYLGFP